MRVLLTNEHVEIRLRLAMPAEDEYARFGRGGRETRRDLHQRRGERLQSRGDFTSPPLTGAADEYEMLRFRENPRFVWIRERNRLQRVTSRALGLDTLQDRRDVLRD